MKQQNKTNLEQEYEDLRRQMRIQHDKMTLAQFKILSRAYKIGKSLYGNKFGMMELANDFNLSFDRVKRILSLKRMSKRTEQLVRQKKISPTLVAQITYSRNRHFQDELVTKAIDEGWSTYTLKNVTIDKLSDIKNISNKRVKKAIDEGYTRKWSAYQGFCRTLNQMELFTSMPFDNFPDKHHEEIRERLRRLKDKIERMF